MIPARRSQLPFYKAIPLFIEGKENEYILYKPAGITIQDMRVEENRLPHALFIRKGDKMRGIQETQEAFNLQLMSYVKAAEPARIKETVVSIVEETLSEPRSGSLEGIAGTLDILISDYAKESRIVTHLVSISSSDYSTIIHSINVMALALGFAFHCKLNYSEAKALGLSALLHDTGKTKIPPDILKAPRKLTDEEFQAIQCHSIIGYNILKECRFTDPSICLAALEHHEKLDGSGYPEGKKKLHFFSQVIAIIDCYEALTNDDRPYRSSMPPIKALDILKNDVEKGKFDKQIFKDFAYSLVKDH